jgi:transcriptional regulator with XRE-family HTH domain
MTKKDQNRYAKAFGRQIRRLRINAGLRRKDAYLEVGIHPSNLDKIEKGRRKSWIVAVPKLAKFLNVHQRELFNFYFDYIVDEVVVRRKRGRPRKQQRKSTQVD